jgi:hypothetical protein
MSNVASIMGLAAGEKPTVWRADIANMTYDSVSFSVATQENDTRFIAFNDDGTIMYVGGITNDTVYQYSLSTAWDLSTASYASKSFSISTQESSPNGVTFKEDGTKMYIIGTSGDDINQYSLSTAWDISTASFDSVTFSVVSQDSFPVDVKFKTDGTKMYVCGSSSEDVFQYSLSTPWDVSTASYDSVNLSMNTEDKPVGGIYFTSDGKKMYMYGHDVYKLFEYDLSTAWDLSTATYNSVSSPSTSAQETLPRGFYFKPDGLRVYTLGTVNNTVHQYTSG